MGQPMDKHHGGAKWMADDGTDAWSMDRLAVGVVEDANGIVA